MLVGEHAFSGGGAGPMYSPHRDRPNTPTVSGTTRAQLTQVIHQIWEKKKFNQSNILSPNSEAEIPAR